jgi:hypothetical protein
MRKAGEEIVDENARERPSELEPSWYAKNGQTRAVSDGKQVSANMAAENGKR